MSLNDYSQELNGIHFILLDDAKKVCEFFSKKNRKKNNQAEYMLSDDEKHLYVISRTPPGSCYPAGWCGDHLLKVATQSEFDLASKSI